MTDRQECIVNVMLDYARTKPKGTYDGCWATYSECKLMIVSIGLNPTEYFQAIYDLVDILQI